MQYSAHDEQSKPKISSVEHQRGSRHLTLIGRGNADQASRFGGYGIDEERMIQEGGVKLPVFDLTIACASHVLPYAQGTTYFS